MKLYTEKLNKAKGYFEGRLEAVDTVTSKIAANYKKRVCKSFIAISPDQIDTKISGDDFYITKKLDGEMNVIFFDGSNAFIINTGGKVRTGIPCIEEA